MFPIYLTISPGLRPLNTLKCFDFPVVSLLGYIMKVLVQKRIVDTKLDIYVFISYIW